MKVIIKTFNDRGRAALLWHRREEEEFREKARRIPAVFRTKRVKKFLKTEAIMYDDREVISGFEHFEDKDKMFFIESVNEAMISNGAKFGDFEVTFKTPEEEEAEKAEKKRGAEIVGSKESV